MSPRIRTTKPEFWTSEQVVECSPIARLLFIGAWNFCDDRGVHVDSPKRLKMEIFPADEFTPEQITKMIDELVAAGLLRRYVAEGQSYLWVTGWRHQKIEKPTYKYPPPPVADESASPRRELADASPDSRPRNGVESNGVESNGMETTSIDLDDRSTGSEETDLGKYLPRPFDANLWESLRPKLNEVKGLLVYSNGNLPHKDRDTIARCVLVAVKFLPTGELDRIIFRVREAIKRGKAKEADEVLNPPAYFRTAVIEACQAQNPEFSFHRAAESFAIPEEVLNPRAPECSNGRRPAEPAITSNGRGYGP